MALRAAPEAHFSHIAAGTFLNLPSFTAYTVSLMEKLQQHGFLKAAKDCPAMAGSRSYGPVVFSL